jgi:excisionase family DNA binding protein
MPRNAKTPRGNAALEATRTNVMETSPPVKLVVLTDAQLQLMLDAAAARAVESVSVTTAPRYVDMAGLCRELGVSVPTARKMIAEGMPHVHCGEQRRFSIGAIESWLATREQAGAT